MALQRFWNNIQVPILSKNLIEQRIISSSLNDEVVQDALDTFDAYSKLHNDTNGSASTRSSATQELQSTSQRRRGRTKQSNSAYTYVKSRGPGLTVNDYFFEHQRVSGYTKGTPILSQSAGIQRLSDSLMTEVETYLQLLGGRASSLSPLIQNGIISLDLWAAIQKGQGAYHKDHVHEGVILSGVYYAKTPTGCAPLVLHKPILHPDGSFGYTRRENLESNTRKLQSSESDDVIIMNPKEGQVIIFPPWLLHGVPNVETDSDESNFQEPRVSFAFNLSGAYAGGDPWSLTQESIIYFEDD